MSTQTEQLQDVTQTESSTNHIWWGDVPIGRFFLFFCFEMQWLFQYSWNWSSCSWMRGGQSQLKMSLHQLLEFKSNRNLLWIHTCEVGYLGWRGHQLSQLKSLFRCCSLHLGISTAKNLLLAYSIWSAPEWKWATPQWWTLGLLGACNEHWGMIISCADYLEDSKKYLRDRCMWTISQISEPLSVVIWSRMPVK